MLDGLKDALAALAGTAAARSTVLDPTCAPGRLAAMGPKESPPRTTLNQQPWGGSISDGQGGSVSGGQNHLGLLVDAECLARENKRLARLLKEAKLRLGQACVEDIDYPPRRELDKAQVRQLATCRWVHEQQNVIVTGPTGVGKTFVACALAQQACRKGFSALYRRSSRLFDELALARADGSYVRVLAKLARIDVLVIDDWGITAAGEQERRDFLEVLEDRYGQRSTIMTSQLPPKTWHQHLADETLADAILDRILHNAHRIVLKGPSRRKPEKETQAE